MPQADAAQRSQVVQDEDKLLNSGEMRTIVNVLDVFGRAELASDCSCVSTSSVSTSCFQCA
jgi:hypothetical protein